MLNPDIPRRYADRYPADVLDKLNLTYLNRRKGDPHIPWGMGFGVGKIASEISFEAVLEQLEKVNQMRSTQRSTTERSGRESGLS